MSDLAAPLREILARQDGAVTCRQLKAAGLSEAQLRTLLRRGWTRPHRGIYVEPEPADPMKASLRAALLTRTDGVLCGFSAARIRHLQGLPLWTPAEQPQLIVPVAKTPAQRRGARTYYGLQEHEWTTIGSWPVTTLDRTVDDVSTLLRLDDLVCLVDSALRLGWDEHSIKRSRRGTRQLRRAAALSDRRAESGLETHLRLLFSRAGLPPEALQFEVSLTSGLVYRLDFAWPSRRVAVEADGRESHDKPDALYRDRRRQNDLVLNGWVILRFTWFDLLHRPDWVIAQLRSALMRAA